MATRPTYPGRTAEPGTNIERGPGIVERGRTRRAEGKQARLISTRNRRGLARWLRRTANRPESARPLARTPKPLLRYRAAAVRNDLLEIAGLRPHDYSDRRSIMQSRRSQFPHPFTPLRRTFVLIPAVVAAALAAAQSASSTTSPTPIVSTGSAVNVDSDAATVWGSVDDRGEVATYRFDYGTSINYTSQTISEPVSDSNSTPTSVDARLTGLSPNTVYHYRIEATDAWGTSYGTDQTFTTGTGTSGGTTEGTSGSLSPLATFTATAVVIHNKCGFTGMFNASGSLPAAGTSITQYAWSFGDGSSSVTTSPQAFHSYHAGTYHVVLTVTDADGTSAAASRGISGGSGSLYCR